MIKICQYCTNRIKKTDKYITVRYSRNKHIDYFHDNKQCTVMVSQEV